jgi:hypothetical protein
MTRRGGWELGRRTLFSRGEAGAAIEIGIIFRRIAHPHLLAYTLVHEQGSRLTSLPVEDSQQLQARRNAR